MDRTWLNKLNQQPLIDPEQALRELRKVEYLVALSDLEPNVKALRTNSQKRNRELREACLFCFGMSQRIGQKIWVCPIEEADFDFVAVWHEGDTRHLALTQLKEVVPEHLNTETNIQAVIDGLVHYRSSEKLTVAIHLTRGGSFDPMKIVLPQLHIAELWVFGAYSEDQSRWLLYGDMLGEPDYSTFEYPNSI
jgi:hypothetical protein